MAVRLTVIGSSPAWPNPGGACSGYLVDGKLLLDCGPGVLAKLRQREPWPTVEAIAITHLHLDHWGDLIPWVWGSLFGPGESAPRPQLWLPPGSRTELRPILARLGSEDMFERAFEVAEYESRTPFTAAGLKVTAVPVKHYDIEAFGFRVEGDRVLAYSGDSGPCPRLGELAHDADLLLCEATLASGDSTARRVAPSRPKRSRRRRPARTRNGSCSPTVRRSGPRRPGPQLAYDGLELEL